MFDDLCAEQDPLEAVLAALDQESRHHDSAAPGSTVTNMVLHLAQTEEFVPFHHRQEARNRDGPPLDEVMDQLVFKRAYDRLPTLNSRSVFL